MTVLEGARVRLRPATRGDVPELAAIRRTPEVHARWRGGDDMVAAVEEDFAEPDITAYVIEFEGRMRRYERDPDGTWHDGLLMELLADEFIEQP